MATITITIADADLSRVVDDICGLFGYQAFIPQFIGPPLPNPETKNQFAKRMVVQDVKSWCKTWEQQQAKAAAEVTAGQSADLLGIS
jgi:hypothetical protein